MINVSEVNLAYARKKNSADGQVLCLKYASGDQTLEYRLNYSDESFARFVFRVKERKQVA